MTKEPRQHLRRHSENLKDVEVLQSKKSMIKIRNLEKKNY